MPAKKLAYILIVAAALSTMAIGLNAADFPSLAAIGFITWSLLPYLYLAGMNKHVSTKPAIITTCILALLTSLFGLWLFIDMLFIHPDAQSGLVFIFAPLRQLVFLLLAIIPWYFLNRSETFVKK